GHAPIIQALIEAGGEGTETALVSAATRGDTKLVQVILDKGKLKPESLTKALTATPARHTAVVELLKKAGAKPKPADPKIEVKVDPALLAAYAGTYRSDNLDLKLAVEAGQLSVQPGAGSAIKIKAVDKGSFKAEDGSVTVAFQREKNKVTGVSLKYGKTEMAFRRVEASREPAPGTATVEDRGGVVKM